MILEYPKINKNGQTQTYYTHTSFLDLQKFAGVCKRHQERQASQWNWITGLTIASAWLISDPTIRNIIPKKICSSVFVAGTFATAYLGFTAYNWVVNPAMTEINEVMMTSTIPIWKNKNYVPNIDKMFFHLDDDNNQKVDALHHGLTAQHAAAMFPDQIIGPIPEPLVFPVQNNRHQLH